MRRAVGTTLVALAAIVVASPAHAHLVETGFGAFYDGIAHFAVSLADMLIVIALALFAGLRGTRAARHAMFALPAAWLVGGALGALWPTASIWPVSTTLSLALTGALVALDAKLSDASVTAFVIVAGALYGFVNGATMTPGGAGGLALLGAVCAIFFVNTILAAEVTVLPVGWPRIAVRIAGSWIAATGMLMLGWLARPTLA